jgi:type II secretory pathway component PulM
LDGSPGEPLDPLDELIIAELSRPVPAPDLTNSIMQRLGFQRELGVRMIWRRVAVWSRRVGLAAAAMAVLAIGWHLHQQSPSVRRPIGPTIPAALERNLQRLEQQGHDVLQGIRQLQPAAPSDPSEAPIDEDINRSALAPFTWV